MKHIFIILSVSLVLLGCAKKEVNVDTPFNFLLGHWERTNQPDGRITKEHWGFNKDSILKGKSFTLVGNDTAFVENMSLIKRNDSWLLQISRPTSPPIDFKITEAAKNTFTAQNRNNEFPKVIEYSYFNEVLTATVSGDSTKLAFIYWPVEE